MSNKNSTGFSSVIRSLCVWLPVGAFFLVVLALWDSNKFELVGLLPVVLIFGACLAMHFLLHGGAGAHRHGDVEPPRKAERDPNPK